MFEKLIWIDAFMLVGALSGAGTTVGDVERQHCQQVLHHHHPPRNTLSTRRKGPAL